MSDSFQEGLICKEAGGGVYLIYLDVFGKDEYSGPSTIDVLLSSPVIYFSSL